MTYFLTWTPILLVFALAVLFRRSALGIAFPAILYAGCLCYWGFRTPVAVVFLAGLDGVLTTLPLLLVVISGILLSTLLLRSGAIQRIVGWFGERITHPWARIALLSVGMGNVLEGAGVIAEPVLAPMLVSAGIGPLPASALSIIGYSGLMTLALAGIIVKVLSLVTGLDVGLLGWHIASLSLGATVMLSAAIPWMVPGIGIGVRSLAFFAGVGFLAGVGAWLGVQWVAIPVSAMVGGLLCIGVIAGIWGRRDLLAPYPGMLRDGAPLLVIIVGLSLVNLVPPIRSSLRGVAFPVEIIPVHAVTFRPLADAYTSMFCAVLAGLWVLPLGSEGRLRLVVDSLSRAWRPVLAMALFGALGQMITYSGYAADFSLPARGLNMAWVLAQGTYDMARQWYPIFCPLLGWIGTFLTGYGVASIMLFGKFQVEAAGLLGISPAVLASALAVGASIGSVSSPFKLALATSLCGAEGKEGEIMAKTVPLGIAVSLALGVWIWLRG